ncbi:hypothetical protein ACN27G_27505 [Plantactinospora sp. WMMB334]|uniref:hypothetical protein n=1 Tax=Plantactinospora sp. WMMB334 TaxID=3404119 RepID=UPI003B93A74F
MSETSQPTPAAFSLIDFYRDEANKRAEQYYELRAALGSINFETKAGLHRHESGARRTPSQALREIAAIIADWEKRSGVIL